jgi:hypothetical protein
MRALFMLAAGNVKRRRERKNAHGCGVAESLPQIAFDWILRREVEFLEQLWRDGDAACRSDLM